MHDAGGKSAESSREGMEGFLVTAGRGRNVGASLFGLAPLSRFTLVEAFEFLQFHETLLVPFRAAGTTFGKFLVCLDGLVVLPLACVDLRKSRRDEPS